METDHIFIPCAMKKAFLDGLIQSTVPWEKRPFIPANPGSIVCKLNGDSFILQDDRHGALRPILNCQVTSDGQHCKISWTEEPRIWFKLYLAVWCSAIWFMILVGYTITPTRNTIYKAPFWIWLASGIFMTAIGYGILALNEYLARRRIRILIDFVRRLSATSMKAQIMP
jgi:hypothetical protein